MSDKYLDLVNSGFTKKLAKTLGLPRPAKLRRQGLDPDPVPVSGTVVVLGEGEDADAVANLLLEWDLDVRRNAPPSGKVHGDRKSTRLNSSHVSISYAVFCLKKKTTFQCSI